MAKKILRKKVASMVWSILTAPRRNNILLDEEEIAKLEMEAFNKEKEFLDAVPLSCDVKHYLTIVTNAGEILPSHIAGLMTLILLAKNNRGSQIVIMQHPQTMKLLREWIDVVAPKVLAFK